MRWPWSWDCAEDGHDWRTEDRDGYLPGGSWYVAARVKQRRESCRCCGERSEWETVDRDYIHSLTMPGYMWDELRANGFVAV